MIEWHEVADIVPPAGMMVLTHYEGYSFPEIGTICLSDDEWAFIPDHGLWVSLIDRDLLPDYIWARMDTTAFFIKYGFNIIYDIDGGNFIAWFETEESYMMAMLRYPELFVGHKPYEMLYNKVGS